MAAASGSPAPPTPMRRAATWISGPCGTSAEAWTGDAAAPPQCRSNSIRGELVEESDVGASAAVRRDNGGAGRHSNTAAPIGAE